LARARRRGSPRTAAEEMAAEINVQDAMDDSLHAFALSLLACATLDDVLVRATAQAAQLFDAQRVSIRLGHDSEAALGDSLPLLHAGKLVGYLELVERRQTAADAARQCNVERAAALLAAAVAAHTAQEPAREHARGEAAELGNDLIATLSHDMRTPLASIKGYASALLLDDVEWDSETRVDFLQAIEAESDHLDHLITDILDSAAIEAGVLPMEIEPVLLPRLIRRVVERFSHRNERHRFVVKLPPELSVVEADAQRIEQVLSNLIDNAVKYSPNGGAIVVRGEVRERDVLVQVIDQGIGIAPEDVAKLFERFFRAGAVGSRTVAGTGLGLPISDAIVRAHGGRIWAESALGRGATLSFTIPRAHSLEHRLTADE
jgi:signal transduction histidine kinase